MNKIRKEAIKLFAVRASLFLTFFLYLIFLVAFFNPDKSVVAYINYFGEANIEFIILLIIMPVIFVGTIWTQNDIQTRIVQMEKAEEGG
ncbi:MAG: hypothetical protein KAQ99_04345 [Candidatus Aureabacteria bacterium]|nr:hypothetical protein [Candidatus Auribacterota bacterium]